ncbi:phage portal protein [Halalkalibacterium halodurans]|uniref:phage portal protein n=1 Tax=Halalkalibacterium halodurans TaxID=86665 RepID=UPI001067BE69|nr:phage portal protein [Halalkalibacterium halodurans]TES56177.1 phage portal protein [Halalkalibacterium halodurans]
MSQPQVKARVIKAQGLSGSSKQIYQDDFKEWYGLDVIMPPYNLQELKVIAEKSTVLQQCIDAYCTNLIGFGLEPEYTFDFNAAKDEKDGNRRSAKQVEAEKEWVQLEEFIKYLNHDERAETIIEYAIADMEKTGNGYLEVMRNVKGEPAEIQYMDSQYMRVCTRTVPEKIEEPITVQGKPSTYTRWKRFRRYAQMVNGKIVYFKEYGDPRIMNSKTGKFDDNTPENLRATEVIHFKVGSGAYGIPRWIGNLIGMYGARKAEELNYLYFKNGRHIPAAILVENGMLSEDSYEELQEYMNQAQGVDNAHKFLLLEVEGIKPTDDLKLNADNVSNVRVQIKSLAEMLQQDALFLEYDEKHREKLRSSFRLPPIYVGEAKDLNRATADTARKVTEEQVFQPMRNKIVGKLNSLFLPDLGLNLVRMVAKGPDFRDPMEIAKVLIPFVNARALAPNDLRDAAGRILGKTLEEWPEEIYNRPLAREQQVIDGETIQQNSIQKAAPHDQSELVSVLKDLRDYVIRSEEKR